MSRHHHQIIKIVLKLLKSTSSSSSPSSHNAILWSITITTPPSTLSLNYQNILIAFNTVNHHFHYTIRITSRTCNLITITPRHYTANHHHHYTNKNTLWTFKTHHHHTATPYRALGDETYPNEASEYITIHHFVLRTLKHCLFFLVVIVVVFLSYFWLWAFLHFCDYLPVVYLSIAIILGDINMDKELLMYCKV